MPVATVFFVCHISILRYVSFVILQLLWEQRVDVRKCGKYADQRIRVLHVAACECSSWNYGEGGWGWVSGQRYLSSFLCVYVYFLFSCVHAALITLCAQFSQVLYLSSLVLGWEQVVLSLVDKSMIVTGIHPQNYPIT